MLARGCTNATVLYLAAPAGCKRSLGDAPEVPTHGGSRSKTAEKQTMAIQVLDLKAPETVVSVR